MIIKAVYTHRKCGSCRMNATLLLKCVVHDWHTWILFVLSISRVWYLETRQMNQVLYKWITINTITAVLSAAWSKRRADLTTDGQITCAADLISQYSPLYTIFGQQQTFYIYSLSTTPVNQIDEHKCRPSYSLIPGYNLQPDSRAENS